MDTVYATVDFGRTIRSTLLKENAEQIFEALNDTGVLSLNLEYYRIRESGAQAVINGMQSTKMKILKILHCEMDGTSLRVITEGLSCTDITGLHLRFNYYDVDDNQRIWSSLVKGLRSSKLVRLKVNYPNTYVAEMQLLAQHLKFTKIKYLDLSNCQIGDNGAVELARGLKGTPMKQLFLQGNEISNQGAKTLIKSLAHTKITQINLSDNKIGTRGVEAFAKHLKKTRLTHLGLNNNGICPQGIKILAQHLKATKITHLYVHRNDAPNNNYRVLVTDPVFYTSSIKTPPKHCLSQFLDRVFTCSKDDSNHDAGNNGDDSLVMNLKKTNITHIRLSKNDIGSIGARVLLEGLKNSKVTNLILSYSQIGTDLCVVLAHSLKYSKITSLNLRKCEVGDEGVIAIANNLKYSYIKTLDLCDNKIGTVGAKSFAQHLKNTTVETLLLSFNEIQTDGAESIASCLQDTNISRLELQHNDIGFAGIKSIVEGSKNSAITYLTLGSNNRTTGCPNVSFKDSKLKYLDLSDNNIRDNGLINLSHCLENSQVFVLDIGANPISSKGLEHFASRLKKTQIAHLIIPDVLYWPSELQNFSLQIEKTQLVSIIYDRAQLANRVDDDDFSLIYPRIDSVDNFKPFRSLKDCEWLLRKTLYENLIEVNSLVAIFKSVVTLNDGRLSFRDKRKDIGYLDKLMVFIRSLTDTPGMAGHLKHDAPQAITCDQVEEFVKYIADHFALLIARRKPNCAAAVNVLKQCETANLPEVVESLLYHRPIFWIDEINGILHPYVYTLLSKYGRPLYNDRIEPGSREKILKWCVEHQEIAFASEVVALLSD